MMPHNKRQLVFLLPLALICAVLLFAGGPHHDSLRSYRYAWGTGHLFGFALWTYLYSWWRRQVSFWRLLVEVIVLAVLLGGATELLQQQIGREGTWPDLGNDVIGSLFGLFFFSVQRMLLPRLLLKGFQLPILLLLLWTLFPIAQVFVDDLWARHQFPLLSGFETPLERTRWKGSARRHVSDEVAFSGEQSLRVRLSTQRYSGIGLKDFPRDWQKYGSVSIKVYNPEDESFDLHARVHDQDHNNSYGDRYNTSFRLHQGWNSLMIDLERVRQAPKTREMDLQNIAGLGLFVGKLERPRTIYLDEVQLLP